MVAYRLPANRVSGLKDDPDRKVRIAVAQRIEGADLVAMLSDPDYVVRRVAARRVSPEVVGIVDARPSSRCAGSSPSAYRSTS